MEAAGSKRTFSPFLVIGHLVNDTFSNMLSGLLPILIVFFDLSYLLAGLLATVFNITSSILQPLLGRWFDRTQSTWLLEVGLALNCVGMSLVGFSPNFVLVLFLVGTAGLGTAAFHPPAFSTVAKSSSSSRGGAMGIFLSGGNTGFFLGPIVAGALVSAFGLQGTIVMLPIGLLTALLLLRVRNLVGAEAAMPSTSSNQPANKRLVGLLATITALRSIMIQTAVTFLPLYFFTRGDSLFLATTIASIWLGVGVLGQLGGGFISDRVGRKPVIVTSLLVGAVLFYGFLVTTGSMSLILLALSGAVLYSSWSVIVAMSSEAAPNNVGAVAGLMLGFSVGVGGIASLGFGALADLTGLHYAFIFLTGFAFVAGLAGFLLPRQVLTTQPSPVALKQAEFPTR